MPTRLVLGSGSATRRSLLDSVGLTFDVVSPPVDEAELKRIHAALSPGALALRLAEAKALAVSALRPSTLVIGADQVLDLDGCLFDKPATMEAAADQLRRLRARSHDLHSAVALATENKIAWHAVDRATLTMRSFSESALEAYLAYAGEDITSSVGAYRIEGAGLQLFERIDGAHSTILGLPMLPLLAELRARGLLPE